MLRAGVMDQKQCAFFQCFAGLADAVRVHSTHLENLQFSSFVYRVNEGVTYDQKILQEQ
jgi:hypothetical protein